MEPKDESPKTKGIFGVAGLPVTRRYIYPASRRKMIGVGGGVSLLLLLVFVAWTFFFNERLVMPGPLTSKHAFFETKCSKCHEAKSHTVTDAKCKICHEKTGDKPGVYSLDAHYLYLTTAGARVAAGKKKHPQEEGNCFACHVEHRGREVVLTQLEDTGCVGCHAYGSLNKKHPEFEFIVKKRPDDATLKFTHVKHTQLLMEKIQKETGSIYTEQACFYCHQANPDGKTFQPIRFEPHCGEGCHLTAASKTATLPLSDPKEPSVPGVVTLEEIREGGGPGMQWALFSNPNEFKSKPGGKVLKSPVHHSDPWVLENMRRLRRGLGLDDGLTTLLKASPLQNSPDETYKALIGALKEQITELRGDPRPEVQSDLGRIEATLKEAERMALPKTSPKLFPPASDPAKKAAFEEVALRLTEPCLECHFVENLQLKGVRAEQQVLHRARFDHRAHILDRRCLECHAGIPIEEGMTGKIKKTEIEKRDHAGIQNIPAIENCKECHTPKAANNACIACHDMHPNKTRRGTLQLFVERPSKVSAP
jgi:hypothetical protein